MLRKSKSRRSSARAERLGRPTRRGGLFERLEERCLLATHTWDGGGSSPDWNEPLNWVDDVAPAAGDDLVFGTDAPLSERSANNNFPVSTTFGSMTVAAADYSIGGNPISLSGTLQIHQSMSVVGSFDASASQINVNAPVSATGTSRITLAAARNITLASGSSVKTFDGDLTLNANQAAVPTAGNFVGIDINNATVQVTGTGMLRLAGRGGNGAAGLQNGVHVRNGGQVRGGFSGSLSVVGTGGNSTGSFNHGVTLADANSVITSGGGNVDVNCTGGGSGTGASNNRGVQIESGAVLSAGGNGLVSVIGKGGPSTGNGNYGVGVSGSNSRITSSGGAVIVAGEGGGSGDSSGSVGVYLSQGQITAGGTGTVTVTGTGGGTSGGGNYGLVIDGGAITSGGGAVDATGTGGGSILGNGGTHYGVYVLPGGQITAGSGGAVTVNGTGGNDSGTFNAGIRVQGTGRITSSGGPIDVVGQGGAGSASNFGVWVVLGGQILSGGSASVVVSGTGGAGSGSSNHGLVVEGTGSVITSAGGAVLATGTGGGSGASSNNSGVRLGGGVISAGGLGSVSVQGTGGASDGISNLGVELFGFGSLITSSGGNVLVIGQGGGTAASGSNRGIMVSSGGIITAGAGGNVVVQGTGGIGTNGSNTGVLVTGTTTTIKSSGGNVQITGTGGGGASGADHGVSVISGGQLTAGGNGSVTVTGTGGVGSNGAEIGVQILGATSSITSGGGSVSVTGVGGSNSSSMGNDGVLVDTGRLTAGNQGSVTVNGTGAGRFGRGVTVSSGGQIGNTGNGAVSVTGTASSGSANNQIGVMVFLAGSSISSAGGTVDVTGIGGGTASTVDNFGVYLWNTGQITSSGNVSVAGSGGGSNSTAIVIESSGAVSAPAGGSITLRGNSMRLDSTVNAGANQVLLQPTGIGYQINLGSTTDTASNTLELSDAELNRITAGTLRIGDASAGAITISQPISPSGTSTLHLITGGAVTQTAPISKIELAVQAFGHVTLDMQANEVDRLALESATGGVQFRDATSFTVTTVNGLAGISAGAAESIGLVANSGNVTVVDTTASNDLHGPLGITITLVGSGALFSVQSGANLQTGAGGNVNLTADKLDLVGTITAAGQTVLLVPFGTGKGIDLGSAVDSTANTLELSRAELDRITAGALRIGNGNTGAITISQSISPLGADTLHLITASAVSQSAGITVANLAVQAGGTIGLSGSTNDADAVALRTTAGHVAFEDVDGFTVGQVSGVAGIGTPSGSPGLLAFSGDIIVANTSAANDLEGAPGFSINVTMFGPGAKFTVADGARVGGGGAQITADRMDVAGTMSLAATVTLQPISPGQLINLGSTSDLAATTLELSDAELNRITAGTLRIGDASAGAMTISADLTQSAKSLTLISGSGVTGAGAIINGSATPTTITIDQAGDSTYGGQIGGPSSGTANDKNISFTKQGAGRLTLSGSSTHTGSTSIGAGTLLVGGFNALPTTTAVTVAAGATWDINATGGFGGSVGSLGGAGTVLLGNAPLSIGADNTSTTFSGEIRRNGQLIKQGAGIFTLAGTLQDGGNLTIDTGTIRLGASERIADDRFVALGVAGATLDLNGFDETIGGLSGGSGSAVLLGAGTLTVGGLNIPTNLFGNISGTGGLTKTGTATLTLEGANSYTGLTDISSGVLNIKHPSALGSSAGGTTVAGGAALQLEGNITVVDEPLIVNAHGIAGTGGLRSKSGTNEWRGPVQLGTFGGGIGVDAGSTLTVAGQISGPSLAKWGGGRLILNQANTYTGATELIDGILQVRHGSALGSTSAGTTVHGGAATLEIAGSISADAEPLTVHGGFGPKLINVSDQNTWSGVVTLFADNTISVPQGKLTFQGAVNNGGHLLTLNTASSDTGAVTLLGDVTGAGGLKKIGAGTASLAGANSYTGTTSVDAGVLAVQNAAALGAVTAGTMVQDGATLQLQGSVSIAEPLNLSGAGAGNLGALRNQSGFNSWTGSITLAAASTIYQADHELWISGNININGYDLTYYQNSASSQPGSIYGAIAGTGGFIKEGPWQLNLGGANTYSGRTTVSEGILGVAHDGTLGDLTSGTVVLSGGSLSVGPTNYSFIEPLELAGTGAPQYQGGALHGSNGTVIAGPITLAGDARIAVYNPNSTMTISGPIGDDGGAFGITLNAFSEAGRTLVLSAANTYSGVTQINSGRLLVNGSLVDGSSVFDVNVAAGAAIGGRGAIGGAVLISGGGKVAPGSSPGILKTHDVSFQGGSSLDMEIGGPLPGNAADSHDQLIATGSVTIGSNVALALSAIGGFVPSAGQTFTIINNDGTDPGDHSGEFAGLPDGSVITNFLGSGLDAVVSYSGGDGNDNDVVLTVASANTGPVAHAGGPYAMREGEVRQLDGTQSFDPDESAGTLTYEWDLNYDGVSFDVDLIGSQPSLSFPDNFAARTIALRVADADQQSDIATTTLEVANAAPTAAILGAPLGSAEGTPITVNAQVTDPGVLDTHTYTWLVKKNGVSFASGADASLTFRADDNGTYDVALTVTDNDGAIGIANSQIITVTNIAPTVSLGPNQTVRQGESVTFVGAVNDPGTADSHTFQWTFGDGTNLAGTSTAVHTFVAEGVYTVTLLARDDEGGAGSASIQVTVLGNSPALAHSFAGVTFSQDGNNSGFLHIPPDPSSAVGRTHLVSVVNTSIEWHSKVGGLQQSQNLKNFFSTLSPAQSSDGKVFDPKVIYDQFAGRFVVVTLDQSNINRTARILLAVSNSENPNDGWRFQAINAKLSINGTETWADYPGFAVDEEAIYITANMFQFDGGPFVASRLWIVEKYSLFSRGVVNATVHDPSKSASLPGQAFTLQPAHMLAAHQSVGTFLVSTGWGNGQGDSFLSVIRVDNPLNFPGFSNQFVNAGRIEAATTLPDAPQLGSNVHIETNDSRALHAVWQNDQLWAVNTIVPATGPDAGQTTAHWYKVNTANLGTLMLADQGNVGGNDVDPQAHTYFPTIAVDQFDNMAIGFALSSPNHYAGAYYAARLRSDPAGTMRPTQALAVGVAPYVRTFGGTRNRWGDYTGLAIDPNDRQTFWAFNQFASTTGQATADGDGRWATQIGSFSFRTPVIQLPGGPGEIKIERTGDSLLVRQNGVVLFSQQLALLSGLALKGTAASETFRATISGLSASSLPSGIWIHAGEGVADDDTLILSGSQTVTNFQYSTGGPEAGTISMDGLTVYFTQFEPIVDELTVVDRRFEIGTTGDQTIRLADNSLPNDGFSTLDSAATGAFESITFQPPIGTLHISAGDGNDLISVATLDASWVSPVSISGDAGDDVLDASAFNLPIVLAGGPDNDTLIGGSAIDTLLGGDGDDTLATGDGTDLVDGGAGDNTVTVDLGADVSLGEGDTLSFSLASSLLPATIDWGDGHVDEIDGGNELVTAEHRYADNGQFQLVVSTNGVGGAAMTAATVSVTNVAPVLSVSAPANVEEGSLFMLSLAASDPGADTIHQWHIDWGDGVVENVPGDRTSVGHTYADGPNEYLISISAADEDGVYAANPVTVAVTNVAPSIGAISAPLDPRAVNTAVSVSATFEDVGTGDMHAAVWTWGDDTTSAGTITESSGAGTVSGSHNYSAAGVYTVKLTITDDDGASTESTFRFVVVYDPSAGFVTGGGWIDSPEGAYTPDPTLVGRANFGFISKYKNGTSTPDGQTQFQFQAGDVNFYSTSYEWLVIAGANGKFKGEGTINGQGRYGFMLTATDGQASGGGGIDKFRIKIWDKNNADIVVYDNKPGAGDDSYDGTALGGGSIVLHKNGQALTAAVSTVDASPALLTQPVLNAAVTEAIGGWAAAGISSPRLEVLNAIDVDIAQFSGATLGLASSSTNKIWLDVDAAGLGWSIEAGGYDLVSAVSHELGHALGFDHNQLGETLEPGEVHLASEHLSDHGPIAAVRLNSRDAVFASFRIQETGQRFGSNRELNPDSVTVSQAKRGWPSNQLQRIHNVAADLVFADFGDNSLSETNPARRRHIKCIVPGA